MTESDSSPYLPGFGPPQSDPARALLIRSSWVRVSEVPGRYEVWRPTGRTDSSNVGIVVPVDRDRGDFDGLYERALRDIEQWIGHATFASLSRELEQENDADLVRTSWSRGAQTKSGTVPWLDGQQIHAAITQQLIAAAKAAITPMKKLGRSNEYVAREFIDSTILAPSGAGSYVVNALTPLHRPLYVTAPSPKPTKPIRERETIEASRVLRRFDQALSAIEASLSERSETAAVAAVAEKERDGVSYELVSSLAGFLGGNEAAIEVPRNAWEPQGSPREFVFKPAHSTILIRSAEVLRGGPESSRATVTGVVTKLEHEPGELNYLVRIFTTSRGPVRRVTLRVDESTYAAAITAHQDGALIRARGQLEKRPRQWVIADPESFEVLGTDEQDESEPSDLFSVSDD